MIACIVLEIGSNLEHLMILIGAGLSPFVAATAAWISHKAGKTTIAAINAAPSSPPAAAQPGTPLEDVRDKEIR